MTIATIGGIEVALYRFFSLAIDRTLEPSVPTFVCVVCLGIVDFLEMADIPEIPEEMAEMVDFLGGGYGFLDDLGVLGDLLSRFSTWRLIGHGVLCSYFVG